jgi:hypothetical protein
LEARRLIGKRRRREVEGTGGLAAEEGQCVEGFGALPLEVGKVAASPGKRGFGLDGVNFGDAAGFVTGLQDAGGSFAGANGTGGGGDLGVEGADEEIIDSDIGGESEEDVLGVGGGGLGLSGGGLEGAADAAPEVQFVAEIEWDANVVDVNGFHLEGDGEGDGFVAGNALAAVGGVEGKFGEELAAGHAGGGAGLVHAGDGGAEVLVAGEGIGFEAGKDGVVEDIPPFALGSGVAGLSGLPMPVGGSEGGGVGPVVGRADGAGGGDKKKNGGGEEGR